MTSYSGSSKVVLPCLLRPSECQHYVGLAWGQADDDLAEFLCHLPTALSLIGPWWTFLYLLSVTISPVKNLEGCLALGSTQRLLSTMVHCPGVLCYDGCLVILTERYPVAIKN